MLQFSVINTPISSILNKNFLSLFLKGNMTFLNPCLLHAMQYVTTGTSKILYNIITCGGIGLMLFQYIGNIPHNVELIRAAIIPI